MATLHGSSGSDSLTGSGAEDVLHGGPASDPAEDAAFDVLIGSARGIAVATGPLSAGDLAVIA